MSNTWSTVETSKSPSGVATIKVGSGGTKFKVVFEDGSIDKVFHKDDLPEYPVKLKSGKYFVALDSDREEVTRIGPANTGAPVTVRCVDFVRPEEGADPEPKEYENKAKHYSYLAFVALLEIQKGFFRKCQVPMFMHYKFMDDGTGYAAFKGNPSKSPRLTQLMEFLEIVGVLEEPMEYSENILPEILARIKAAKKDFQVIIKKGYVESLLQADEYEEDDLVDDVDKEFPAEDDEELDDSNDTDTADDDNEEFVEDEDL